jgi:cystathionine gamma-synthase
MVFPSHSVASRCVDFLRCQVPLLGTNNVRIVELVPNSHSNSERKNTQTSAKICAVLLPEHCFKVAKVFWQHSGEGVSSRQAEFAHRAYEEGALVEGELAQAGAINSNRLCKGPRRYQRGSLIDKAASHPTINASSAQSYPEPEVNSPLEGREYSQFIEERFGRNLDLSFVRNAKLAVRRRIAGSLIADVDLKEAMNMPGDAQKSRQVMGFSEDDVYLYPTGMSSIFNTHRTLMAARGQLESICFG